MRFKSVQDSPFSEGDRVERGEARQPTVRLRDDLTFEVEGRPPRKGQGKKYIRRNQRQQARVKAAAMARLVERGDAGAWPVDQTCALSVVAVYPDRNHADLSNIVKAVEDGLNGVVWSDDKRVLSYREPMDIAFSDHVGEGLTVVRVEVVDE